MITNVNVYPYQGNLETLHHPQTRNKGIIDQIRLQRNTNKSKAKIRAAVNETSNWELSFKI